MPLQLASVAATSLGCFLLIPQLGLVGAAAGIGAGYGVQIVGELWVLRSILAATRELAFVPRLDQPIFEEGRTR
jgi:O-antigen/teichoic acid export membrane protein